MRKSANRVRITCQLIDASNGMHIWADRYDGALEDIFELQDQVTANLVSAIARQLHRAAIERARKPTENLSGTPVRFSSWDLPERERLSRW